MDSFYLFTAAFAISQIFLCLSKIMGKKDIHIAEIVFCALLVCLGVYLSQPLIKNTPLNNYASFQLLWMHLPTAVPSLFAFCCITLFNDQLKIPLWLLSLALASFFPPLLFDLFTLQGETNKLLFATIPQAIEFIIMTYGFWVVAASWRNDLIAQRRRLRLLVMGGVGGIIFLVIGLQQLSNLSETQVDLLHYPLAAFFLFCFNLLLLDLDPDTALFNQNQEQAQPEPESRTQEKPPELIKLEELMGEQALYKEPSLTITELAYRLELPEYKLRALINQSLGYRNFNDFLNHYRVKAAAQILSNTSDSITQIANDVGYNSLSAFNRAFKNIHLQTPSEFRKKSA